jgi:FixJ family two-component response regulator
MARSCQDSPASVSSDIILVVDDDAAVRGALKFALELEGYQVRTYGDPEALLADTLPERACLVVDYRMPGLDGLSMISRLRARLVDLPVILIVSEALNPGLRLQAGRMGVQDVLEKPLSDGMLLDSIRHAFRSTPA